MNALPADRDFAGRMGEIEALLREVEQSGDPHGRARMQAIVQGLMDLHAQALRSIIAAIDDPALVGKLADDDLVGSVLLLYGLHPSSLEERVRQALDQARPVLQSHGGNVELVGLDNGVVRLRLLGSCHGCPGSAATLRSTIEDAVYARAPDIAVIEVEGETPPHPAAGVDAGDRLALPLISC